MTDDEKWRGVVAALSELLPGMVDTFIARILQDPVYSESGLTIEDLRRSSHDSLVAILGVLQDGGTTMDALESIAAELGKRRARQGLPLDSLVRAIRLDFSVVWDALSASALAVDPALLVSRTELVWRTVDTFASRVQARYVAELDISSGPTPICSTSTSRSYSPQGNRRNRILPGSLEPCASTSAHGSLWQRSAGKTA
ncbi:hypothetical protein [Arthrobacter sp. 2MCAF14]|uniref:hypothetical protein n=1 Tax=Arthrobacter sp. 2MCAF14 TaxID=3232982 RepID=UPI003F939C7A